LIDALIGVLADALTKAQVLVAGGLINCAKSAQS
jgi:hypothetical protein